jgi:hypothetical protein
MVLCDYPSGIIRGIRGITVMPELMMGVKHACFNQIAKYQSINAINLAIQTIQAKMPTVVMIAKTKMHKL